MTDFLTAAQAIQDKLVSYRRHLHANPELDLDLPMTTAFVKEKLNALGLEPQMIGESGILVTMGGKLPGKVVLLRADMDALPVKEETALSFASETDNMHACGHDLHTAMLLGAAEILKQNEDTLQGTVKLMFQPGEETLNGAKMMVEAGILENPKVDAAMMIHVFTGMPLPDGKFIIPNPGPATAASDWFEVVVQGRGGHGAMPNFAVDPLNVIAHLHIALQAIISREIAATDSAVLTIGLMEGGKTANVIPDTARIQGTVRTFDPTTRIFIEKRIREMSASIAETFRAQATVNYNKGCPTIVCDKSLVEQMDKSLVGLFGISEVLKMEHLMPGGKMMGSEDFSFVTQEVPSIMIILCTGNAKEGFIYPQHHPKAVFTESSLYKGAAAYAIFAKDWLAENA